MTRWVLVAAFVLIATAQVVRHVAISEVNETELDEPFAPSQGAAPFLSLGYRETLADLLFFRLVGYFGGRQHTPEGVASLVEAIVALDPQQYNIYKWGGQAMVAAIAVRNRRDNALSLRAIKILEAGAKRFPNDYKIPKLAGEVYLFDLTTKDPAERRMWDEKAAHWIDVAVRKPSAPASLGTLAAHLQSKLGHKQRAIDNLRELILTTDDEAARTELLDKLAELEQADSAEIASELLGARKAFETAWRRERPEMSPSLYLILGAVPTPGFDMRDLATGGRDLVDVGGDRHEPSEGTR